jgi:hypothetical protein
MRKLTEVTRMSLRTGLGLGVVLAAAFITGCTEGSTSNPAPVVNVSVPTPVPTAVPTATPAPTATPVPTAVPPSALTAPSGSSVAMTKAGQTGTFTVTENGYSGTLTASNGAPSCSGIATVAPASGTGPSATFTITAVAAGICQIKVQDTNGQTVAASVTVTTTSGNVSSKRRD